MLHVIAYFECVTEYLVLKKVGWTKQWSLDLYDMTQSASVFVTKEQFVFIHILTCHVLSVLTKSVYRSQPEKVLQKWSNEFKSFEHVFRRILPRFFVKEKVWIITTLALSSYQTKVHSETNTESISYFDLNLFTSSTYRPSTTDKRDGDTRKKM